MITMNKTKSGLILTMALMTGCVTTTNLDKSGINRKQFMLYPSSEYFKETSMSYAQMMTSYRNQGLLDNKPEMSKRVLGIAKKITAQVADIKPEVKNWKWEIHVINTGEPNAFCTGQGKMGVYEGVITKLKLTDDEVAAIIGHEIAHALLEHGRERASRDLVANIIISKINGNGQAIAYYASQLGLALPFNRSQESEADLLGLKIAAKAGYNPKAAITLWQKFGQIDKNSNNKLLGMLSTHPLPEKRMNDLKAAVPQFMPYYYDAMRQEKLSDE